MIIIIIIIIDKNNFWFQGGLPSLARVAPDINYMQYPIPYYLLALTSPAPAGALAAWHGTDPASDNLLRRRLGSILMGACENCILTVTSRHVYPCFGAGTQPQERVCVV